MNRSLCRGATVLDTGPLVAWFDRSDQDPEACAALFHQPIGAFVSTWPVLIEVCHLIPADQAPRFLSWVSLGGLILATLDRRAFGVDRLPGGESLENLLNPGAGFIALAFSMACRSPSSLRGGAVSPAGCARLAA